MIQRVHPLEIYLPDPLWGHLHAQAAQHNLSLSQYASLAVAAMIEAEANNNPDLPNSATSLRTLADHVADEELLALTQPPIPEPDHLSPKIDAPDSNPNPLSL
jgi:hypothetical protein